MPQLTIGDLIDALNSLPRDAVLRLGDPEGESVLNSLVELDVFTVTENARVTHLVFGQFEYLPPEVDHDYSGEHLEYHAQQRRRMRYVDGQYNPFGEASSKK